MSFYAYVNITQFSTGAYVYFAQNPFRYIHPFLREQYKKLYLERQYMVTVFIRTLLIYVILIISMRLMGKRQVGELQLSELKMYTSVVVFAAIMRVTCDFFRTKTK